MCEKVMVEQIKRRSSPAMNDRKIIRFIVTPLKNGGRYFPTPRLLVLVMLPDDLCCHCS